MWQINYPMLSYIILNELRRIALGEIVDDLKVATNFEEKIGLSDGSSINSPLNSKTGLERLGSPDISVNLGPTFLIVAIVLLIVVVLALVLTRVASKIKLSLKW